MGIVGAVAPSKAKPGIGPGPAATASPMRLAGEGGPQTAEATKAAQRVGRNRVYRATPWPLWLQ
jgi:hypothetical protein